MRKKKKKTKINKNLGKNDLIRAVIKIENINK